MDTQDDPHNNKQYIYAYVYTARIYLCITSAENSREKNETAFTKLLRAHKQ